MTKWKVGDMVEVAELGKTGRRYGLIVGDRGLVTQVDPRFRIMWLRVSIERSWNRNWHGWRKVKVDA